MHVGDTREDGKTLVEVFIAMDKDGAIGVGTDSEEAVKAYDEAYGDPQPIRVASFLVWMKRPEVEQGPTVEIPDEAGEVIAAANS